MEEEELVLISLKGKLYFGSDGQHLLSGVPRAAEQNISIEACCVLEVTAKQTTQRNKMKELLCHFVLPLTCGMAVKDSDVLGKS